MAKSKRSQQQSSSYWKYATGGVLLGVFVFWVQQESHAPSRLWIEEPVQTSPHWLDTDQQRLLFLTQTPIVFTKEHPAESWAALQKWTPEYITHRVSSLGLAKCSQRASFMYKQSNASLDELSRQIPVHSHFCDFNVSSAKFFQLSLTCLILSF